MAGIVLERKPEKSWIRYIRQRIRQNKNFLGFLSGPTGSGKSFSCIRICQELDPSFHAGRIVFTPKEMMTVVNSGELKKGSCIIWEEVGIALSNRNWQGTVNKVLNFLLQTFRHLNLVVFLNAPYLDFIDSNTRKLFHGELRTVGINFKTEEVCLKPMLIQYNSRFKKFYFKYLKVITPEGVSPVTVWHVAKPTEPLLSQYLAKKKAFCDKLNQDIFRELEALEEPDPKPLTDVQAKVYEMLRKKVGVADVAEKLNISVVYVRSIRGVLRRKGYRDV